MNVINTKYNLSVISDLKRGMYVQLLHDWLCYKQQIPVGLKYLRTGKPMKEKIILIMGHEWIILKRVSFPSPPTHPRWQ